MSLALYRKYRSRSLDEILGQDHVTNILKRALEKGRIAHAYLLTGPRGTGKTSIARILAHEINELPYESDSSHLDIIEIDAASNNGVDDIRNLREKAQVAPVSAKRKIYIIDEVHMLSKPAFNALLKTLEEPPEHIVFILATTDADKVPATILSRVQQYYFHPISSAIIAKHLIFIAQQEGFTLEEDAAQLIAERSRGGFRDSISLLDQLSSLAGPDEPLTRQKVASSLGLADQTTINELLTASITGDTSRVMQHIHTLEAAGIGPLIVTGQLLHILRQQLATQPQTASLISQLIEVTKHPHPDLKLITTLLAYNAPEMTTPPPSTPAPQAPRISPPIDKPQASPKKTMTKPKPTPTIDTPAEPASQPRPKSKPEPESESKPTPKKTQAIAPAQPFDWAIFLEGAKQHSIGLYSLLVKCGHEFEDNALTLYSGTVFTKKKLEDARHRSAIGEILAATFGGDIAVDITNGQKPPKDEKVAAIAAMMGGGEEISLEEVA